jgi:hypothetical protein
MKPLSEKMLNDYVVTAAATLPLGASREAALILREATALISGGRPKAAAKKKGRGAGAPPRKRIPAKAPSEKVVQTYPLSKSDQRFIEKLKKAILDEIYAAICKNVARYKKYTGSIAVWVHGLIGAIANQVAKPFGIGPTLVATLVAPMLSLIFAMGITAFCGALKA